MTDDHTPPIDLTSLTGTAETCAMYSISRDTLRLWRERGCPFLKIGSLYRFDPVAVRTWVQSQSEVPR